MHPARLLRGPSSGPSSTESKGEPFTPKSPSAACNYLAYRSAATWRSSFCLCQEPGSRVQGPASPRRYLLVHLCTHSPFRAATLWRFHWALPQTHRTNNPPVWTRSCPPLPRRPDPFPSSTRCHARPACPVQRSRTGPRSVGTSSPVDFHRRLGCGLSSPLSGMTVSLDQRCRDTGSLSVVQKKKGTWKNKTFYKSYVCSTCISLVRLRIQVVPTRRPVQSKERETQIYTHKKKKGGVSRGW